MMYGPIAWKINLQLTDCRLRFSTTRYLSEVSLMLVKAVGLGSYTSARGNGGGVINNHFPSLLKPI